jgi:hypothetical protein
MPAIRALGSEKPGDVFSIRRRACPLAYHGFMRLDLAGTWVRSVGGRTLDSVRVPGSYPPVGECVLARRFAAPSGFRDGSRRIFLHTEGVLASAEFFLNGTPLGRCGPWCAYDLELPRGLIGGKNEIRARIRDIGEPFGPVPGRRFDAGLVRDIYLESRPAGFIKGAAFRAEFFPSLACARVRVLAEFDGSPPDRIAVLLTDPSGKTAFRGDFRPDEPIEFDLKNPRLWSPGRPQLYSLKVGSKVGGMYEETVGIRSLAIEGQDFFLNSERLVLKGVCRHEFSHRYGYSPPAAWIRRELSLIKRSGFNFVRLVHSPQAREVSRLAAELGLLVSEEPGACWHDLRDQAIAVPAVESLRRTVLRDRNVPSVLAWLIYNECDPNVEYASRAAAVCRELDPGRPVSCADCSGKTDEVRAMVETAGLSFYGFNVYDYGPGPYLDRMKAYPDKPVVFTEWGGYMAQGNERVMKTLGGMLASHTRAEASPRNSGFCFWAWADYEERSRGGPAAPEGWTIEGLTDREGAPKPDLILLSGIFRELDRPAAKRGPKWIVLLKGWERAGAWSPVPLPMDIESSRELPFSAFPPPLGKVKIAGIPFEPRRLPFESQPVLLGPDRPEIVIPVGRLASRIAVLGHVALKGGYPSSSVSSVHHRDAEKERKPGDPASEYVFVFDDGEERQVLLHGVHVLKGNNICRWWRTAPRAPETRPAVEIEVHPAYEILRIDLWERTWPRIRMLREIRWRLLDGISVQALYALTVAS